MSLMDSLSKAGASGVAIIVWGLTTVLILGAVNEARLLTTSRESLALTEAGKPPVIQVKEVRVDKTEYERVATLVKQMHPQLRVGVEQGGKTIVTETNDLAAYYEWLISIYDIITALPDAKWTTSLICAGEGCSGSKHKIALSGVRRVPEVKAQ